MQNLRNKGINQDRNTGLIRDAQGGTLETAGLGRDGLSEQGHISRSSEPAFSPGMLQVSSDTSGTFYSPSLMGLVPPSLFCPLLSHILRYILTVHTCCLDFAIQNLLKHLPPEEHCQETENLVRSGGTSALVPPAVSV